MEKTVVFSVRLPESLVKKLNEVTQELEDANRNHIIEKALEAFCFAADLKNQRDILYWWRPSYPDATLKFDYEAHKILKSE